MSLCRDELRLTTLIFCCAIWVLSIACSEEIQEMIASQDQIGGEMRSSPDEEICTPGRAVECPCLGGLIGVQSCLPSGSGFDVCQCPEADPQASERSGGEVAEVTPNAGEEVQSGAENGGEMGESGGESVGGGGGEESPEIDERDCDGDVLIESDGTRFDCASVGAMCQAGVFEEHECVYLEGGGPQSEGETPRFLTHPLDYDAEVKNGWTYNFMGNGGHLWHGSIDYQASVGTPLYASCAGRAMQTAQYASGLGYGRFIQIRCDQQSEEGQHYHLIYGHVQSAVERIQSYPQAQRHNSNYSLWTRVDQGDIIGYSGSEDTSWPHLHFQVKLGSYGGISIDAYDLYESTVSSSHSAEMFYPPNGSLFEGCGPDHLWITCPPAPAIGNSPPLSSPELQAPINDSRLDSVPTHLTWVSVENAERYRARISSDSTDLMSEECSTCVVDEVTAALQTSDLSNADLTPGIWYYWSVRAGSETQGSPFSNPWRFMIDASSGCACPSGVCCEDCAYRPASTLCDQRVEEEYRCASDRCGADIQNRVRHQHCSGTSSSCDGALTWTDWESHEACSGDQVCVLSNGDYSCSSCAEGCEMGGCLSCETECALGDAGYADPNSNDYDGGGAQVMQLRLNAPSGCDQIDFTLSKPDGSSLGAGRYLLRVGTCRSVGAIRQEMIINSGQDSIEFVTDHRGALDEVKAFCVTKEDGGHSAWWWSNWAYVVQRETCE